MYFLDARVRTAVLAGYVTGTNAAISAGDSLLVALGKLEGQIAATASGSTGAYVNNGNSFGAIPAVLGTNDNFPMAFETFGTTKMTILANGNVGIGTASPGFKLELAGTSTAADRKIGINGSQVLYLPDQASSAFTGSIFIGNGGGSLSHSSGTQGYKNSAFGLGALQSITTGYNNTSSGNSSLYSNTTGYSNTANGVSSLYFNTTGYNNTASGNSSLYTNTTGYSNTAIGSATLTYNTTGYRNTANGDFSLYQNTTGYYNTALGTNSALTNIAKSESTAIGSFSQQYADDTASPAISYNTALGAYSLQGSADPTANTGIKNTALGHSALLGMSSGSNNIGIGYNSGSLITTGSNNVVIGSNTGSTIATSSNNVLIADGAGTERLRIISTGYMGLGTSSPQALLDLTSITTGILIPRMTTAQRDAISATGRTGMQVYNTTTNELNFHNGTAWTALGAAGSGVTQVTRGAGLVGNGTNITATGTIAVDVGTGNNQIVQLDGTSKLPAVDGSALINLNPANLSATVPITKGGTGRITGGATNTFLAMDAAGTALEYKAFSAATPLAIDFTTPGAAALTLGTVPISKGGTGLTAFVGERLYTANLGGSLATFFCSPSEVMTFNISGAPICSTLASLGGSSQWTTSGSNIYYTTGKVGVGTSTPGEALEVVGNLKVNGVIFKNEVLSIPGSSTRFLNVNNLADTYGLYEVDVAGYAGSGTGSMVLSYIDGGHSNGVGSHHVQELARLTQGNPILGPLIKTISGTSISIQNTSGAVMNLFVSVKSHNVTAVPAVVTLELAGGAGDPAITASSNRIMLQGTSPGTTEIGNLNISGNGLFGGNVGIGTGNPLSKLHVNLTATGGISLGAYNSTTTAGVMRFVGVTGTDGTFNGGNISGVNNGAAGMAIINTSAGTGNSQDVAFYTHLNGSQSSQKMILTSAGNVGIGATSPTAALEVSTGEVRGLKITNTSFTDAYPLISAHGSNLSANAMVLYPSGKLAINTSSNTNNFTVNGNMSVGMSYMNIAAPTNGAIIQGNVGIGTSAPAMALDVRGNLASTTAGSAPFPGGSSLPGIVSLDTSNAFYPSLKMKGGSAIESVITANTTSGTFTDGFSYNALNHNFLAGGSIRMLIRADGNVGIGLTNPGYKLDVVGDINASGSVRSAGSALTSDIRLKENLIPVQDSLKRLSELKAYNYYWKDKKKFGDKKQLGLVAQEVEKVFPEAVMKGNDGFLAVSYANLVAPLIESVKELYGQSLALYVRVTASEKQLALQAQKMSASDLEIATLKEQLKAISRKPASSERENEKIKFLEAENASMKSYLCQKDPSASFCKK
ncbi:MAG TPA: tail fiber domain-containing protein [Bacteriovoracaceae bacterium]|nr:tail fiber domain-containing protein [Bacteriovoracaceae bacterium]